MSILNHLSAVMELSLCEWKIALFFAFWEARDDHTNRYKAADVSINMILQLC
jgi:hypothetical protein